MSQQTIEGELLQVRQSWRETTQIRGPDGRVLGYLSRAADRCGESSGNDFRILFAPPLAVTYSVLDDDQSRKAVIVNVREYGRIV